MIIKNNKDEVLSAFAEQIELALEAVGSEAEGFAVEDCPVDTSRLKNSITHEVVDDEKAAYIGTNVEYAEYVEYGDGKNFQSGKAHFLRDAVANHGDLYREIIKKALEN